MSNLKTPMFKTRIAGTAAILIFAVTCAFADAVKSATPNAAQSVLVVGGDKDAEFDAVRELIRHGVRVSVFIPAGVDTTNLGRLGVPAVMGNALDAKAVQAAIEQGGFSAIVSTVGAEHGNSRPDHDGIVTIIAAAKAAGVRRFVLITDIGVGDSSVLVPPEIRPRPDWGFVEKAEVERTLIASGLDYTIIRPGGVMKGPATGKASLSADHTRASNIREADLGVLAADSVSDSATSRKILHAFDPTLPFNLGL